MTGSCTLIVDDDPRIRGHIRALLGGGGDVMEAATADAALAKIDDDSFAGIVISDYDLGQGKLDGLGLHRAICDIDPTIPFILITGVGNRALIEAALRQGVYDFLPKPFQDYHLLASSERAHEKRRLVLDARRQTRDILIGGSALMEKLRRMVETAAKSDWPVLIVGERGTEKDKVAQRLHRLSRRRRFEEVRCAALSLGSQDPFAPAPPSARKIGVDMGTLYLADVERLSADRQAALAAQCDPATRAANPSASRIIASTAADLAALVKAGQFDAHLFDVLSGLTLHVPPLRLRREDIVGLFEGYLREACEAYEHAPPPLTPALRARLEHDDWRGNLAALRSFAESVAFADSDLETAQAAAAPNESLREKLAAYEASLLREALKRHAGDVTAVRNELQLSNGAIYQKLREHGLKAQDFRT